MKLHFTKNLLTFVLALFLLGSANAQSKLGQLKFQDAEELFAKDDFNGALLKLEDAEKLTGKTNPPMLYLRIQSLNGLFLADPYANYKTLESLRKSTATFLKEFENVKGIDDKYRDVYKIGESLSAYPKDYESFAAAKTSSKIKKEDKALKEKVADTQKDNAFMDFNYYTDYNMGITLAEAKERNGKYFKRIYEFPIPAEYEIKERGIAVATKNMDLINAPGFFILNNRVCGAYGMIESTSDNSEFSHNKEYTNKLVTEWSSRFGFSPEIKTSESSAKKITANTTTYTWRKNSKMVRLSSSQLMDGSRPQSMMMMHSIDEKLAGK